MKDNQFSSMKIFCHADKIARYQSGQSPFPVSVDLSPSNFCNHKCIWCVYTDFLKEHKEILDKDILLRLPADLKAIGVKGINFTGGGEPLSNKFTVAAMEKAHGLGMDVGLITNGSLLDEDSIKRLKAISKYIRISLDAGDAKTYSRLHGVGIEEFEKVLSRIEFLGRTNVQNDCLAGVQLLQVGENRKETFSMVKMLKNLGVDFVEIRPAVNINNCINEVLNVDESVDEVEQLSDETFKVLVRRERFNPVSGCGKRYDRCVSPHFIAAFDADGNVYTCCEFLGDTDYILGNFANENLKDIFEFDRLERKLSVLDLGKCPKYCKTEFINEMFNRLNHVNHYNIL